MLAICAVVYLDARSGLQARQTEILSTKRAQILHVITESAADLASAPSVLRHKLNDIFVGHEEVALTLRDDAGRTIYASHQVAPWTSDVRLIDFAASSSPTTPGALQATLALDTRDDALFLRRLAISLGTAAIGGALLASITGYWLVRQALRPVRWLTLQASELAADTLHRRLSDEHQPEELRPLVAQFNGLLGRLDTAYDQLQGFNADVAHELCTPMATLISSSELALRRTRPGPELVNVIASNLEELRRLAGIVEDMLFLSNADRGVRARRTHVASLAKLALDVAAYHEAHIESASVALRVSGDAEGHLDVALFKRALSNLVQNATRYANPGTTITVSIEDELVPGGVRVSVRDIGVQIAPEDLPRVFDRFYRADKARPSSGNHGLGLSIVAAIARMHEGSVFASSSESETTVGLILAKRAAADQVEARAAL
jgi:two-component system heavy metal sensor histidine kinase CusS